MRTDVKTDKQQIKCPNSSFIGYSTYKAQFGDLIHFNDFKGELQTGRVLGRIASDYNPTIDGEYKNCTGFIVAMVLSHDLSCKYERWIDPKDVQGITPQSQIAKTRDNLNAFLSDDIRKFDCDLLRKWITTGWSTLTKYLETVQPIV